MTSGRPARPPARRIRIHRVRAAGLLAVLATIAIALGYQVLAYSSSTTSPRPAASSPLAAATTPPAAPPVDAPRRERRAALGPAGAAVPDGGTVFDDATPGVANLDRALVRALRRAASAAAADGVEISVTSGWRSAAHQARLLREAVAEYGSEAEAARCVATPETSAHVSGDAVDVGPEAGWTWLSDHGPAYGLCRIYGNEPWHFELRPDAADHGCPPLYPDPTHDPRMQR